MCQKATRTAWPRRWSPRKYPAPIAAVIESALAQDSVLGVDEIAGRLAAANQELIGEDGPARVAPSAWAEAAVKHAQEEHAQWMEAVRNYMEATDQNRLNAQIGNLAGTMSGQQTMDLMEKRGKAATRANPADTALIE